MEWCDEKHFNKELVMSKEDKENFKNPPKSWICDNDAKVIDHCYITGKYRGPAHRDCNISLKLNHKIHVVLHNLKNYDWHLLCKS